MHYTVQQQQSQNGIGFCGLLTIVFIVLKLTGVIDWAWVWVLSPLWISFGVFVIFMIIALLIALLVSRR